MDEVKEATKMRSCIQVELHTRSYNQEVERKYPKLFLRVKIAENVSHEFETKPSWNPHVCDKHSYERLSNWSPIKELGQELIQMLHEMK